MAAASSEPSAQGPAHRLSLVYSAIACLVVFVGAAWWSWRYASLPDPFEPAESRTFWQGLTTPEENAFRRLPVVTGDLHGVFALKGTEHVWAVGPGGMILHSADGGESWEQQSDIDWSPTVPKETEPTAENQPFGLIRSAAAGERPASGSPAETAEVVEAPPPLEPMPMPEYEALLPPAETAEVQRLLRKLGYDPGPADGQPGAKTRTAIEQFQRDASLPVDGKLTRERLAKELEGLRNRPPVLNMPPPSVTFKGDANIKEAPDTVISNVPPPGAAPESGPTVMPGAVVLSSVAFADERLGIAVGDQGVILQTLDGGAHWRRVASGTAAGLTSVAFANAGRALAVGLGGTVLFSTDGGANWQPKTSASRHRFRRSFSRTPSGRLR